MVKKRVIWASVVLIIVSLFLIGFGVWTYSEKNNEKETLAGNDSQVTENTEVLEELQTQVSTEKETEIVETEPEKRKIRLMMLGDNLMHLTIVKSGYQPDGSRNYDMLFEPIKDYLALADIKITNQETIFGGNHLGFSGFPYFNSPTELGDAIAKAGFNVVLHATNHAADKGINGIYHTLNFWEKYPEILVTGIFENANEQNQDIGLLTVDGVTFAILNYTYSPNLAALPKDIQGHLGMLCNWDKTTGMIDMTTLHPDVLTDIAKAKEMADVVIVCPHWGTEYTFVPSSYQKKFAKQMTEAGADLIIGTHPHVIQPVEWIEASNGNEALCFYSLGNYVSSQNDPESMLEAMAWVTFEVEEESVSILESETGAIPMVYQYKENNRFENVYFLDEYTEELAKSHGIHYNGGTTHTFENLKNWAEQVLGEWMLYSKDVFRDSIAPELWR